VVIIKREERIGTDVQVLKHRTFLKRLKGLMFQKYPLEREGIMLIPCHSIHMFFMRFSIDVVFLNKGSRVVKVVSALKPWRVKNGGKGAYSVLELPVGTIEKYRIEIGDKIELREEAVQ
jgi:uncharacterized protein